MEQVNVFNKGDFGKKAKTAVVEVGKWYKFSVTSAGEAMTQYGKVVKIENGEVFAEKVFALPSYRPYAARKWFDDLPMAIAE